MRTIAVINLKGGVAKTITSNSVAYILASQGNRVLLVDNDKQGDASRGLNRRTQDGEGIDRIMTARHPEDWMNKLIKHTDFAGLDVLPANMRLLSANQAVMLDQTRPQQFRIRDALECVKNQYDFCIIDNAPDINVSTINALTAADTVLVPIQCEYYALEGLNQMLKTVDLVKRKLNPSLELEGVVFTMYDARTNLSLQVVESVKSNLNQTIYKTIIPRNVRLAEAPSHGMSINHYSSRSTGAESYRMLAAEVISRGEV